MNNFQNIFGKCVSPPTTVAHRKQTYGTDERNTKSNETRPSGALKIFYESKNFTADEPPCEWKFNTKAKSSRITRLRNSAGGKKKNRKNEKRTKNEGSAAEGYLRKPSFLTSTESQVPRTRKRGHSTEVGKKGEIFYSGYALPKDDLTKNGKVAEKYTTKVEHERTPLNSLFALPKSNAEAENKAEKTEVKPKGFSQSVNPQLSRKPSEKVTDKASEMKTTISDSGKRCINEILKSHAQKVQSIPLKTIQIKDYAIYLTESQHKKPHNAESEAKEQTPSRSTIKNEKDERTKPEETRTKPTEVESKAPREAKEKESGEDKADEKKRQPGVWLKFPQSNELERRLRGSWEDPTVLFSKYKEQKTAKASEEDKNSTPSEVNSADEDGKIEKRVTYTDRLLLLRGMLGKNTDDKKQRAASEEKQLKDINFRKTPTKENSENVKAEHVPVCHQKEQKSMPTPITKEVSLHVSKGLELLKDGRCLSTDHDFKARQTRSTELRDLVTQAIKDHKIFCIFDNHTYIVRPVREELLSRGWLEVIPDRRLIPRRRPPPTGPVYERDKAMTERNCNTLEAILAARETFADEIQETVSRSSFKLTIERPKLISTALVPVTKKSEDSLSEVLSQFRIMPPTAEKKKNNTEIREFAAKYQAYVEKEEERERELRSLREKEKNSKQPKKEKFKHPVQNLNRKNKQEKATSAEIAKGVTHMLVGSKSFQEVCESINKNRKILMQTSTEIKNLDGKIGMLYDSVTRTLPATEGNKEGDVNDQKKKAVSTKTIFSDTEAKTISKIIQSSNARIHFMWLSIKPGIHLKCFNYSPEIVNKFQKTTFCTKIGLWSHLNNMQWYAHEVTHPAKSPRMYNTGEADDMRAFFQDFQLTACIGMLKWLSNTFFERGLKAVQAKRGKVPLKAFEFAIKQCERYMRFKDNEELNLPDEPNIRQEEWNTFLQWFYIITNDHGKVQESSSAQLMVVYTKAVETLKMMKRHWPEIDIDGRLNIWIMKPYCASCGRGIFMTNNVYYISQHSKYIVQKYIEKPLLIYNTKFDIRQWFMITKLTPLEIWMYKECYLRFCSQPFALRNLHESVHLSNNSVQRKYISLRDPSLPNQNMWDSNTFQLYLKTIGHPNAWEEIIYPGMKDAIVSTMLAAQDTFDGPRKSWFEVYGADFMLSANVKEGPWLIEINENPAMDPSTKVTARLCPQMLRDVIKVVVDKRANKNASTGQWELIYRQNYSPSFGTVDLDVRGKKIARVPLTTKVSFNLPPSQPALPRGSKNYTSQQVGQGQFYDIVKSLEMSQKTGKQANENTKSRDGTPLKDTKTATTQISMNGTNEVKKHEITLRVRSLSNSNTKNN